MKTGPAVAEILKREGVEYLFAYPVNHLIEHCAALDIRPIIVRQERIGLHMADAMSRLTKGRKMGVFCMQSGPGSENAYGGVAQAFGESIPLLVIPQGYPRRIAHVPPNFNSTIAMAHVAKHCEPVTSGKDIANIMRRAFSLLRNGRGSPVIVELPNDGFEVHKLRKEGIRASETGLIHIEGAFVPDGTERISSLFVPFVAATILYLNNRVAWTEDVPHNSWITNLLLVAILVLFAFVGFQEAAGALK